MEVEMTSKKPDKERGRRLAAQRERLGLTQGQVSERVGVKEVIVSRHERGFGMASPVLAAYSRLYGMSAAEIMGEDATAPKAATTGVAGAVTEAHEAALRRFLNDGRCNPLTDREQQYVLRHLAAGESDELDELEVFLLGFRYTSNRTDENLQKLRAAVKRSFKKSGQLTLEPTTQALPAGKRKKAVRRAELM
jgi:transcriptional regulator with XRE-family HTH domain